MSDNISFKDSAEVYKTFNVNVYLFKYYKDFNEDLVLLFDNNLDTDKYIYYKKVVNENINNQSTTLDPDSKEVAKIIIPIIDSIRNNNSHNNRKKALAKYDELKNEHNDFDNPEQAPKYAKQIVDSYK